MKQVLAYFFIVLFSLTSFAQNETDSLSLSLTFDPFEIDNEMGRTFMTFLQTFERTGHLTDIEGRFASKKVVENFGELFKENAKIADDLSHPEQISPQISIEEYLEKASSERYQKYLMFLEKGEVMAYRKDTNLPFMANYRIFKLFSDNSIIGTPYEHGAIYSLIVEIDPKKNTVIIQDIKVDSGNEFFNFPLGKYAYSGYANMRVTNKLEKLTQGELIDYDFKAKKESQNIGEPFVSESGRIFQMGYQMTNFMGSEDFINNISDSSRRVGSENGFSVGLKFQKAFGRKGFFGFMGGLEYEYDYYSMKHNDLAFIYEKNYSDQGLKDLEGGDYDRKHVQVSIYTEQGHISYIRPQAGIFFNIGMGQNANLSLNGSVGYSYILTSAFSNKSYLSYQGEKYGFGDPITEEQLGFYDEYIHSNSGTLAAAKSFANYSAGMSLDFKVGERNSLGFLVEYKNSLTPAFESGDSKAQFLDPEDFRTFNSQLNILSESRLYESYGIHIYLKHHFMGKVKR